MNIYKEQTTAEKGRKKQEGSLCYLFGIISKAEPARGWPHTPCPKLRSKGLVVSGWLGAISRLTEQLNKDNFF